MITNRSTRAAVRTALLGGHAFMLVGASGLLGGTASAAVINAGPSNYQSAVEQLKPGDTLELAAGTYQNGLSIYGLNGTPTNPIVIRGPASGARAVFLGSNSSNTVRIRESSYVELYNLELDGRGLAGDGVNADGGGDWAHHITIENFYIHGYDADQSIVGISTNGCTTWDWRIRYNVIDGAGTGMYLGNAPGSNPFIGGTIEYNLIMNTVGYNIEIKHQNSRPTSLPGIPTNQRRTIVRHNVFSKGSGSSTGDRARPNLLVGHFPLSGAGATDVYEIYGNFFYQNPVEALFQGEGNVAFYGNVMVTSSGSAINIQPHNDVPREIRIFNNTIIAADRGIRVSGGAAGTQQIVAGNAVFAPTPLSGGTQTGNVTGSVASAATHLVNPTGAVGSTLDLYPKAGALTGATFDTALISGYTDANRDFNGTTYDRQFRGAYSGSGTNPGWRLALARKPMPGEDHVAPAAPTALVVQ